MAGFGRIVRNSIMFLFGIWAYQITLIYLHYQENESIPSVFEMTGLNMSFLGTKLSDRESESIHSKFINDSQLSTTLALNLNMQAVNSKSEFPPSPDLKFHPDNFTIVCTEMRLLYDFVPGKSWSRMDDEAIRLKWNSLDCNSKPGLQNINNSDASATRLMNSTTVISHEVMLRMSNGNSQIETVLPSMSWKSFTELPFESLKQIRNHDIDLTKLKKQLAKLNVCSKNIVEKLKLPILSDENYNWCSWALQPKAAGGAGVQVGQSWGTFNANISQRQKFDSLNCNAVKSSSNDSRPTCANAWGDAAITNWRNNPVPSGPCKGSSDIKCFYDEGRNKYCRVRNVQISFKNRDVKKRRNLIKRKVVISTDCNSYDDNLFTWNEIYSSRLSNNQTCDLVLNETVILVSHEHIYNLAHTMDDIMNHWLVLWLEGIAQYSSQISLLNIDGLRSTHNFNDTSSSSFFDIYKRNFRHIHRGREFESKTVCIKELLAPPRPPKMFVFESWEADLPCSFVGPSTLYQRWNIQVRNSFQLQLLKPIDMQVSFQILLIIRNTTFNNWQGQRTSRNFLNTEEIITSTKSFLKSLETSLDMSIKIIPIDLSNLLFAEQVRLVSESNMLLGMHGAGISLSLLMRIGEANCCGLLELFPEGEHKRIRGFGNMARKMGLVYDRLDIDGALSTDNGATVPVLDLHNKLGDLINRITSQGRNSCVHPDVVRDPYGTLIP